MKKLISFVTACMISMSVSANNIGINFKVDEVTAINSIAALSADIFNDNTNIAKVSIELLDGTLPDEVKSTVDLTNILLTPKQITATPIWVKVPGPGKYSLTLCARGEAMRYGDTAISVRACDTVIITSY